MRENVVYVDDAELTFYTIPVMLNCRANNGTNEEFCSYEYVSSYMVNAVPIAFDAIRFIVPIP